jgi:recombination protein RecA
MSDDKTLEATIKELEKEYGKGIVTLGSSADLPPIDRVSSGSLMLDRALGGGYPRGRLVEIYGPESAGKTTLTLHAIAEFQKAGLRCAFIDMEHALDSVYASNLGVDLNKVLISQPSCAEEALNVAQTLARSGQFGLIVLDSVAALVPKAELEGDVGDASIGVQARLMSQTCRMISGIAFRTNTTVIFTNQIRMKIGIMFGNPETTSGGNALKFYSSIRLDTRRKGVLGSGDDKVGIEANVKVVKNKTYPPFKEALIQIMFGSGINSEAELLDLATTMGLIEKSGSWYSHKQEKIGQGKDNACQWLRNNPKISQVLLQEVSKL